MPRIYLSLFLACAPLAWSQTPPVSGPAATPEATENTAADAVVEGMLFFASDEEKHPAKENAVKIKPELLQDVQARLARVFTKYKKFHLIGKHSQKVFKEYESWVVPSKDLCLKMDSRGPSSNGGVKLHLQLWQDKKVLVKSDTVIQKGQPVFLSGPGWRKGQLVFVVMLKE